MKHGHSFRTQTMTPEKINLLNKQRMAIWNIRTLLQPDRADLLSMELIRYRIAINWTL